MCYYKSIKQAWDVETARLKKLKQKVWSLDNTLIWIFAAQLVYLGIIYFFFGSYGLIIQILYGTYVTLMGKATDYIEHYGLRRKLDEQGIYEPVKP
mmetsp:Transcript_10274/g.7678  ORF Transcript_10274/g.7678 Transcript_10274/m.7678 type:complete len:96 (+) Transcript_10274:596-883(+)